MHHHFSDIRSRIAEPPLWWDENGTPRYCPFTPDETANIYADETVLLLIACQNCDAEFRVCMSWSTMDGARGRKRFSEHVRDLHYGDPPNVGCCPSGPTMNSVPLRVLEFWRQSSGGGVGVPRWVRVAELEIELAPRWARD